MGLVKPGRARPTRSIAMSKDYCQMIAANAPLTVRSVKSHRGAKP